MRFVYGAPWELRKRLSVTRSVIQGLCLVRFGGRSWEPVTCTMLVQVIPQGSDRLPF